MLFTKGLLNYPISPSKPLSYWIKGGTWHPHPLTLLTSKDQYISPGRGQGPGPRLPGHGRSNQFAARQLQGGWSN